MREEMPGSGAGGDAQTSGHANARRDKPDACVGFKLAVAAGVNAGFRVYPRVVKRAFDLVISIVALPFLLIICAAVGIAVKLDDGGPVFYNTLRVGRGGKLFKMYKFRSMKERSPEIKATDGCAYSPRDDPRLTKVGAFIRKTSIDELPQVLNMLIGNMSLIGPRPWPPDEIATLSCGEGARRLEVLPGLTGYAQVNGRNSISHGERLVYDTYYVDHISFSLDAKIFFRTFRNLATREGVYNGEEDERIAGACGATEAAGDAGAEGED